MLHNYTHVTPKAPTELPVDVITLSMAPQKPFDSIAAGWFKGLELRENGDELWGEVEWTPKAAEAIRNKEYRFVSPSFVKDHTTRTAPRSGVSFGRGDYEPSLSRRDGCLDSVKLLRPWATSPSSRRSPTVGRHG